MTNNQMGFSVNQCFELFRQSFNRVKYFSCITDNITESTLPTSWLIKKEGGVSYGMDVPSEEKKSMFINGYKHYMQRYLVRDCIENFALCLDELFFILLLNGKTIPHGKKFMDCLEPDELKIFKKFSKNSGLEEKAELLEKRFGLVISADHKKIIINLKDIRNCLSHNNGTVREIDGEEDEQDKQKRKFHWAVIVMFAEGKSGSQFPVESGKTLPEASRICVRTELRDNFKSFRIHEPLSFSSSDTFEIAWSLELVVAEYMQKINEVLFGNKENHTTIIQPEK